VRAGEEDPTRVPISYQSLRGTNLDGIDGGRLPPKVLSGSLPAFLIEGVPEMDLCVRILRVVITPP
jgi:hypothetical protein